jgi:hypothetical protein
MRSANSVFPRCAFSALFAFHFLANESWPTRASRSSPPLLLYMQSSTTTTDWAIVSVRQRRPVRKSVHFRNPSLTGVAEKRGVSFVLRFEPRRRVSHQPNICHCKLLFAGIKTQFSLAVYVKGSVLVQNIDCSVIGLRFIWAFWMNVFENGTAVDWDKTGYFIRKPEFLIRILNGTLSSLIELRGLISCTSFLFAIYTSEQISWTHIYFKMFP